jgi:hypothetical protein
MTEAEQGGRFHGWGDGSRGREVSARIYSSNNRDCMILIGKQFGGWLWEGWVITKKLIFRGGEISRGVICLRHFQTGFADRQVVKGGRNSRIQKFKKRTQKEET